MPNADNAQVAIVVLMVAISLTVWWMWWRRWKRFGEIWPQGPIACTTFNPAVVTLTIVIVGFQLYAVIWRLASREVIDAIQEWFLQLSIPEYSEVLLRTIIAMAKAEPPISLARVQSGCIERLILLTILGTMLLGFGSLKRRDFDFAVASWRQQVSLGLETAHASFAPVLVLMMVTMLWRQPGEKNALLVLLDQDRSLTTLAWVVLAAVVLAPLIEELLFRVVLLGWLKTKTTSAHAIGISSLAFAFIHGPLDGAALLPLALLLGSLYDRQQRFLSVVVAHGFFNLWNIALTMAAR